MRWQNYINRLETLQMIAHEIHTAADILDAHRKTFREIAQQAELGHVTWMADRPNIETMITTMLNEAKKQAMHHTDNEEVFPC